MDAGRARRAVTVAALGVTAGVGVAVARNPLPDAPPPAPAPVRTAEAAPATSRGQGVMAPIEVTTDDGPRVVYAYVPAPVAPAQVSAAPSYQAPAPVVQSTSS